MDAKRWWLTAPEIADSIRDCLAADDSPHALRLLMDGVNSLPITHQPERLDEALAPPDTTGDVRWDALLAGAIRYRLHQSGVLQTPPWTHTDPLNTFWWPTAYSPSKAYNDMAHTPVELMRLGIFIDEREFSQA